MIALGCPACGDTSSVVKHGTNRGGTTRLRCKACNKTFTPNPNPRRLTPQKQQAIVGALTERISQRGIARALKVSRLSIRNLHRRNFVSSPRKKTHGA